MTPLYPLGIIDQGWYLVIIFFIGLFFGLVLEQSGFSSSRKLAGVFYGYDFVVLKVFFTAGITAMSGLVILGYFGIVDLSLVTVNSNFLLSAVTGGVIMGFGFIIGGFCPGTSVTGAVIGKIDAMFFILGIFIGIFIFGSFDTTFNKLFTGYYFDHEMLSTTLGISKHLLVFLFILMALGAFIVAEYFEKKSTRGLKPTNKIYQRLGLEFLIAIVIGVIILFLPQQKAKGLLQNSEKKVVELMNEQSSVMKADELAYLILHNPKKISLIDLRTPDEFNRFSLPGSINKAPSTLLDRDNRDLWNDPTKKKVLISNGGNEASEALVLLTRNGYRSVCVLDGGLNRFTEVIFKENQAPEGLKDMETISMYRFRKRAADAFSGAEGVLDLPQLKRKAAAPVVTIKKTGGGC
jgi:rhodanese-related sulfurtransferase